MKNAIPCDCGSVNARWYGERTGQRLYMCDACWTIKRVVELLRDPHVQDNKFRLGVLGQQNIDRATHYLTETTDKD